VIAARFGRAPGAEWVEIGGRGSDRRHDAAASSTLHRRLAAAARGQDAAGATLIEFFYASDRALIGYDSIRASRRSRDASRIWSGRST